METLTFEKYLKSFRTEPVERRRSDIINGVRTPPVSSDWTHQQVLGEVLHYLKAYEREKGRGKALHSPFDVLIRREPLQVRQPDLFFISNERLEQGGGPPEWGPLRVAPEIVVEILSIGETVRQLNSKLEDYASIGVEECWIFQTDPQTVEVLYLAPDGWERVAVYNRTETARSMRFPDLLIPVSEIYSQQ
ncbi:MAG: Uma2 family endonuclease [Armatimonadetes bacterium]|nr:Uma2 family endonuclease [Armatimonadota bacterium]